VARQPFSGGQLVIRGSNPEDTTSYINGHNTGLIYHFGGLTSIVSPDLVQRIDYLPGNFTARYGRATGGVVNVDLRAPRRDRMAGYLDVNLFDTGFLLEGPVGKGSWAIAARRSYADAVLNAVIPDDAAIAFTTAPFYWDYQGILSYPLGGGRLELVALGSLDRLELIAKDPADADPAVRGTIGTKTYVQRLYATWRKPVSDRTDLVLTMATGANALSFDVGNLLFFDLFSWLTSYRGEVRHKPSDALTLSFGLDGEFTPFDVQFEGPLPPVEGQVPTPASAQERFSTDVQGYDLQTALYAEAEWNVGAGVTLVPGLRAEYYAFATDYALDPRLSARWRDAAGDNTVRLGVGRYSQSPQPQELDEDIGNPALNAEHAIHVSAGYDRKLGRSSIGVTGFYKHLDDQVVRNEMSTYTNDGVGRVYGAELLVRAQASKKFFGWLSYTISRAERRDAPGKAWRRFDFDQPHILTAVGSWKLPWRLELGFRFRLVSGNPETPIVGAIYDADADVYTPVSGEANSQRLPAFHQLDVRLDRRWVFDTWMLTGYIDVQNAYNRANPEGYSYSYDYRDRSVVSGIPIFPSIGVKGEF
jgi:hypothetical protein